MGTPTVPKEKASIGVGSVALSFPIIIAQEKGFISDAGLDIAYRKTRKSRYVYRAAPAIHVGRD
jgi:ABC-type nitrate/sulfonate/bicarbonate transport system substrate-binding protein